MSDNKESIRNFLSEEGYRPKEDNDGDIIFKSEGDLYFISFRDNDDEFISVKTLSRIDIKDSEYLEVYKLLNKINSTYILGKCIIINDNELISFGIDFIGSINDFKNNLERYLTIIKQMERDFVKEYSDI